MSQPKLPHGLFCRRHPNYKATRAPQINGGCAICDFMWSMARKDRVKKSVEGTNGTDSNSTGGLRGPSSTDAEVGSVSSSSRDISKES